MMIILGFSHKDVNEKIEKRKGDCQSSAVAMEKKPHTCRDLNNNNNKKKNKEAPM